MLLSDLDFGMITEKVFHAVVAGPDKIRVHVWRVSRDFGEDYTISVSPIGVLPYKNTWLRVEPLAAQAILFELFEVA